MRIMTFGSCLSRATANSYVRLFGGKVISSVYWNRSDAFLGRFVDQTWAEYGFEGILSRTQPAGSAQEETLARVILKNQYAAHLGLHGLPDGVQALEVLEQQLADLVIVDNYVDLSARLLRSPGDAQDGFFLRDFDFTDGHQPWVVGDYLEPQAAVLGTQRVMDFFKTKMPKARFVFINFPHNVYQGHPRRIQRTIAYEQLFSFDDALVIPCINIPVAFQTPDKEHFKSPQYHFYAGMIYDHLLRN